MCWRVSSTAACWRSSSARPSARRARRRATCSAAVRMTASGSSIRRLFTRACRSQTRVFPSRRRQPRCRTTAPHLRVRAWRRPQSRPATRASSATRSVTCRTSSSASRRLRPRTRSRRRSASSSTNGVGVHAPAVLLVSFLPILLVALAYKYLNRADPDAGTTFAWGTRALGPWIGWINGWAIFVADVIVMASLSVIASTYTYLLFNWHSAARSTAAILIGSAVWIALMTWICWRGIELSARIQQFLLGAECVILAVFAVVALAKVYAHHPAQSLHVHWSWFDPFSIGWTPMFDGVLLGVFIYWGWDSGVSVN